VVSEYQPARTLRCVKLFDLTGIGAHYVIIVIIFANFNETFEDASNDNDKDNDKDKNNSNEMFEDGIRIIPITRPRIAISYAKLD
jgi:hypothetical protein